MDCDKNFNLNLNKLVQFLSEETYTRNGKTYNKKTDNRVFAVIVVHCFGFPVNLERITSICKKKNILIVEDAAESLGSKFKKGKYKNCHTGSVGDVGIFSFNGNKIITGGGGGIVISNKKKIIEKIRYLINQAKDNPIKFIHNDSGYNLRITNLQSAIIYSQLKRLQKILLKKKKIHNYYKNFLNSDKYEITKENFFSKSNYWLNVIKINNYKKKSFNSLVNYLISKKIQARYVWYPNHLQKPFKNYQKYKINNALNLVKKSICLPSGLNLKETDISKICKFINNFK